MPPKKRKINAKEKQIIKNGLSEAILGFNPGSIGAQLSQVDTMFLNERWYLISNMRQILSQVYVEHGLIQTVIDVPVDDAFRGGVTIKSKQMEEDEINRIEMMMEEKGDIPTVAQAHKWKRLFGGAGIVIMTDQQAETPLDIERIDSNSPLEFRAVDMWELFWSKQNTDDYSAVIDPTERLDTVDFYNYYGRKLHHSRVMKLVGKQAPSFVRPRLRGWGFSVIEPFVRSINQYLKATDLMFEVLDEFKIDVYKIKGLTQTLLAPNGTDKIRQRIQLANQQKNYQNAVVMDGEDDFIARELTFAGLAEAMDGIKKQIASDLRMPLTKIFGISAQGFSSGEDDIENYNSMVESTIRSDAKFEILKMIKLRCQQEFGYVPTDLTIEFKPLRVLSSEQEENVKSQKFARLLQSQQAGLITAEEFRDAANHDQLLPLRLEQNEAIELGNSAPAKPASTTVTPPAEAPKSASEPPTARNSLDYDLAAYEADGGDQQFDKWRERTYHNPRNVDKALWEKSKAASMQAFGKENWQFILWYYMKHGGKELK